ncbi:hypothetical protein [Holdemania massiliensis]|uniref:hypothetical protein n=1 Tax=Holdemania massiliensis TaxID=1468449 RepID=UPI003567149A
MMTRVEDQLWQREQDYLYGAGCQMESDEEPAELVQCACGDSCYSDEVKHINDIPLCPECYKKITGVHKKFIEKMRQCFSDDELIMLAEYGTLEEFQNGILDGTVSV